MTTTLTSLYAGSKVQQSKITQAGLDTLAAGAGLLVLKGLSVKFEVGQLPVKTLLMGTGLVGLSGALGREISNFIRPYSKVSSHHDQNTNPLKLGAMAAFAIGAIVLSQAERVRTVSYVGRIVSMFPQFASRHQMIAFAVLSNLSMAGMRFYFGAPSGGKPPLPNYAPQKEISTMSPAELFDVHQGHGKNYTLSSEQITAYNQAAMTYNRSKGESQPELPLLDAPRRRERRERSEYAELPVSPDSLPENSKEFAIDAESVLADLGTQPAEIAAMAENPQGLYDMFNKHGDEHRLTEEQARAYNTAALVYNATEAGVAKPLPLFYKSAV